MTNLTVIRTSPNPELVAARARRHTSIAARKLPGDGHRMSWMVFEVLRVGRW